jgi:DNA-binding response OmpR family regulator
MNIPALPNNILVVEDNIDIANLIKVNLQDKSTHIDLAADGTRGFNMAVSNGYQLIILDLMLPGMGGIDLCRALRSKNIYTPVLMLTAKTSELDRVLGLEVGADDYLIKPFSVPELVARVKAIIRRNEQYQVSPVSELPEKILFQNLSINPETRQVFLHENEMELTAKEFDLLWHFASNPGRVYSRAQLLSSVWGYGHNGYEHTVNSHINRLRSKIEVDPAQPRYVMTVWGVGYKFNHELKRRQ